MQILMNIVYLTIVGAAAIGALLTCIGVAGWAIQTLADFIHDHRLM